MTREPGSDSEATSDSAATPDKELPPPSVLEIEPVYEALCHPRRRYLCYTLLEDAEWSLTDLATRIAAWENDVPEHAVTENQREAVYVSLYHAHVPKLVEAGVISHDEVTERITAGEHADQVVTALEGMATSLDTNQAPQARSETDE